MGNLNQRLNGLNPLSYMGVNATQPPQVVIQTRQPTTNDNGFELGTIWLIPQQSTGVSEEIFSLIDTSSGIATWVQLYPGAGGGATSFPTDSGTANEMGGDVNIFGSTNIATSASGNTVTIATTGIVANSFPTDSGTATPSAGVLQVLGGSNIATSGSGDTVTVKVSGTTNHSVQVGNGSGSLSSLSVGTTGQLLTGVTGANPGWATPTFFSSVATQVFTGNGTYTPTSGMKYCIAEVVGGGGGGGGSSTCNASQMSAASGGAAGGYSRKSFPAATIGVSQAVTVGAAGVAGLAENNAGGTGGTSSLGSLISATGGTGGGGSGADTGAGNNGSVGGVGSGGSLNNSGAPGGAGNAVAVAGAGNANSGFGGSSIYGGGAPGLSARDNTHTSAGVNAGNYGSGGSGGVTGSSSSGQAGGTGSAGIVIITEYI